MKLNRNTRNPLSNGLTSQESSVHIPIRILPQFIHLCNYCVNTDFDTLDHLNHFLYKFDAMCDTKTIG